MDKNFKNINIRKEFGVEKDPLVYEAIKMVQNMLQNRKDFISITPVGSKYRGYSREFSDIDLLILFDSLSKIEIKNNWILNKEEKIVPRHLFLKGKEIEIHPLNIHLEYIKKNFKEEYLPFLSRCFQGIFSPSNNKKIQEYRNEIKKIFFDKIPEDKRLAFINKLSEEIANLELYSGQKMKERILNFDIKKRKEKIMKFWERRLNYFLLRN